jgi:large subunit ribosomal protein L25
MEALSLQATNREVTGKKVKKMRLEGLLPAVVYGHGVPSKNLAIDYRAFEKLFSKAGESSLVDLSVEGGESAKVLIQDVTYNPMTEKMVHVDFRQVNMKEVLEAEVILKFIGEAPSVKSMGAILVRNMDTVTVRCLPGNLVHEIEVNLSGLTKFEDRITVADLPVPAGVELLARPEQIVVIANAPMTEDELAASLETKTDGDVTAVKAANEEKKAVRDAAKDADAKKA